MLRSKSIRLAFGLLALATASTYAQSSQGFTMQLFGGKTLNGWDVSGCEAIVHDGTIRLTSGNGF